MRKRSTPLELEFKRDPQEIIDEVLSRFSVLDLREMSDADLNVGMKQFEKEAKYIRVLGSGQTNYINWWNVRSGSNEYQVRRFQNFVWCSCLGFFFSKTVCKHAAITTKEYGRKVHKEMENAPYLKLETGRKPESVGKFRI